MDAETIQRTQLLLAVNIALVVVIVAFSVGIAVALVRRSMLQRVEAERLAAMGTATARIIHQVKNPLASLLIQAEMLGDEELVRSPESRRDTSRAIMEEASRMSELLVELSAYAAGAGRRLDLRPTRLAEVVEESIRSEAPDADRSRVRVTLEGDRELTVSADPYFLRQAFDNVLRNAIEAVASADPAGRPPEVRITLRRRGPEAVVEVRDDGPGIDPDKLGSILEPFVTTKSSGMGLGLPICRDIVEGHGGRFEIRSKRGRGTTVTMSFPLEPDAAA